MDQSTADATNPVKPTKNAARQVPPTHPRGRLLENGRAAPLRTCVGCRVRAAKSDLLRLVVVEGSVVPDPRGRLPGRGASLHLDLRCLELAERRRAFPRAFRLPGPLDTSMLREHLKTRLGPRPPTGPWQDG